MVGFDHQDVGIHPSLGEVPVGGRVADVDRRRLRQVVPVVVSGGVARQSQHAEQDYREARHENRCRPTDHGGAETSPEPGASHPLGLVHPDLAAHDEDRRPKGDRAQHHHDHADRHRRTHGREVRQTGKTQAVGGAGDRQARSHHDGSHRPKRRVVRIESVFTVASRLFVAAEQEDPVIGGGRDREHREDVARERRQTERAVLRQNRDHAARSQQRDEGQEQLDERRADRPVDDQQHGRDRHKCEQRDLSEARVADHMQVVGERGRTGDVGLHARRCRRSVHDLANPLDGFVGERLTLLTGQVQHHVRGFAVGALGTRGRQPVPPEVLDVLDVLGVPLELADDAVVVVVRVLTERLVALDHDHHRAVGVEFVEVGAHPLHRDHRRRVFGGHRRRVLLADHLELRSDHVDRDGEQDPEQQDRQGQDADRVRQEGALLLNGGRSGRRRDGSGVGHADFTKQ